MSPKHILTDAELDANLWASCGPAALAGLLGRPLAELRHAFPAQTAKRTWTNLNQMLLALRALSLSVTPTPLAEEPSSGLPPARTWPRRGLLLVQFRGTWDAMPTSHPAQLQRSHWIAVAPAGHRVGAGALPGPSVFDVNAIGVEFLQPFAWWQPRVMGWEKIMAPLLAEGFGKKASGAWWVRAGLEVAL